ncbi:hypothetical protein PsAD2_03014 [Pseudovibrio axinellae]|uniref:Uncharacterized protein n=1 Tax=Pseudovibrio axinellae TaxID=989403 RepID=A0A165XGB9_9HYPH|nr:hypothetical protein [Pseudovibrio axinellae]KZL17677.1 hypothetical protein PsAD2_03014 [Pseudovibrio axinellae]SER43967.1 hypothetical protein SAMN05421798_11067 [Pseudovibrio axinellae]
MHQKSYVGVGEIIRKEMPKDVGTFVEQRTFGDLAEEVSDAELVLRNWLGIACFNVGTAVALKLMERAREDLLLDPMEAKSRPSSPQ